MVIKYFSLSFQPIHYTTQQLYGRISSRNRCVFPTVYTKFNHPLGYVFALQINYAFRHKSSIYCACWHLLAFTRMCVKANIYTNPYKLFNLSLYSRLAESEWLMVNVYCCFYFFFGLSKSARNVCIYFSVFGNWRRLSEYF